MKDLILVPYMTLSAVVFSLIIFHRDRNDGSTNIFDNSSTTFKNVEESRVIRKVIVHFSMFYFLFTMGCYFIRNM